VFEFPKQKLVFGPRQVVARIRQDLRGPADSDTVATHTS